MKAKLTTISLASLIALLAVWGVLVSFDWVQEYFATKQNPAYQELPFEFKLKADAKDVIFSEAYQTENGTDVVKYAYVAGEVGPQLNEDLKRRTPESYTEVVDEFENKDGESMETLKTTFLSRPQFYEKEGKWRQIEYATTTPETFAVSGAIPYIKKRELVEWLLPGTPVFATVSTFYPNTHVETTSVDGYIICVGSSFVNLDDAIFQAGLCGISSSADDSGTSISVSSYNADLGGGDFNGTIERGLFLFDTSSLGASANISAATLSVYVGSKTNDDNDGSDYIQVYSTSPASNTALQTSDGTTFGGTTFVASATDITSISTSAYLSLTLNSNGQSNISKTSISKFGIREGHDIAVGGLCDACTSGILVNSADQTGTSQDPKLEVTYTVPATFSFGMWFPF